MNEEKLTRPVQYIKSIGPKRSESLKKVNINTVRDLLFYFPSRHLDRSTILNSVRTYQVIQNGYEGEVTILGRVQQTEKINFGKKQIFKVSFKDGSGFFEAVWFNGIRFFQNTFHEGELFAISAKPVISKYGSLQFIHPDYDRISEEESNQFLNTGSIIPFYKIPKELREANIGDLNLRRIISSTVLEYSDYLPESLPSDIIRDNSLLPLAIAVRNFHFPESSEMLAKAKTRMKYEEIFFFEVMLALKRKAYKTTKEGIAFKSADKLINNFLSILPFRLTESQIKVIGEIRNDMLSPEPMNRLLQGDVGSGKTIVALIAMLTAVGNGYQAVMMAPTEILADQHAKNISQLMKKMYDRYPGEEVKVTLLLGGQSKSVAKKKLVDLSTQEADIIIGTHTLLEENVNFRKPGIIVIDEQHRFGVQQRAALLTKGAAPDVLIMSATPIPRTLSMTLYGDLDVSIIKELPGGRKKIKTALRGESSLPDIYNFVIQKAKEGTQTFIVYPLVEESEKIDLKAAETYYEYLKESYLKTLRVGLIHGRMSWQEKEEMMILFKEKRFDVLISTTVIEVGIDIPDANIMIINDAYRFGLSQLHQLRGRIGRGNTQGYCILITKNEFMGNLLSTIDINYLSPALLDKYKSQVRLQTMVQSSDGFKIAEVDFKLRGPGNIFGTAQSGQPDFRFIDLAEDYQLISKAKQDAFNVIEEDPLLSSEEYLRIKKNLEQSLVSKFMLGDIA